MKQKTDYIFFGLTGLIIVNTIIQSQLYNYALSINNYLSFVAWPIALFLRLKNYKVRRYPLAFLLILATINIFNFGLGAMKLSFSIGDISSIPAERPGVNPIILLILIAYYFVNKKSINRILNNTFRGTPEERKVEYQKTVDFYLNKFNSCNKEELKDILKDFNDYPEPAKIALRQIQLKNDNA
ncbi:hypothetical protein GM921_02910 [Pedobacter sp. LMG 31464]|uniref:Uncharacterized protein n=1 Tax=Pedobacter planticolens TaxID=2679964 RepID=A0A923IT80_9SPHI|nr:hypothetical protein [Pedobacter planticolens]MBB2144420.1 hypothetical protein [Pedobacter planticolens]